MLEKERGLECGLRLTDKYFVESKKRYKTAVTCIIYECVVCQMLI